MEFLDVIIAIVAILLGTILYIKTVTYAYWKKKGLPYLEPDFFYGNTKKWVTGKVHMGEIFRDLYFEIRRRGLRHAGIYILLKPVYMPTDPELIKCILQKDFDHFVDRDLYINEKGDPLSGHLFYLEGVKWKNLRAKLTPTFTSGKMKMMFQTLVACSDELKTLLEGHAFMEDAVDIKDILDRFAIDVIGSCAFGVDCNSLKDPDSEFRTVAKKVISTLASSANFFKRIVRMATPRFFIKTIRLRETSKTCENFFINLVDQTIEHRQKNSIYRKDFMHLLLELKNKGKVDEGERLGDIKENNGKQESFMSTNEIAAQCYVFFLAGFETSSITMTYALYEMAINQKIQDRLRDEIRSVQRKHNNKLTYDSIMEMTYLDKIIKETLRLHSPAFLLHRVCNKAYKIPDSDFVLEPGTKVIISIHGVQKDPEYYPNPEVFDPERFGEENKAKRPTAAFLPFGEGPRTCIGVRFGLLQSKVGLVKILENYRVTLNNKTKTPLEIDPMCFLATSKGGVWLNITNCKINKNEL